jgi:hypothetical protein
MTKLPTFLRQTEFLPFPTYAQNHQLYPALTPSELTRLMKIGLQLSRFDRSPALDFRREWAFAGIAGDLEIWAAEVLIGIGFRERVSFGWEDISVQAWDDVLFFETMKLKMPAMWYVGGRMAFWLCFKVDIS